MHSIKEIFIVGNGPSSSHTMGPSFATSFIINKYQNIINIKVSLLGSLAFTGKGHLTDYIIEQKLGNIPHQIVFDYFKETRHPNTMIFETLTSDNILHKDEIYSIGGGSIITSDTKEIIIKDIYPHSTMKDIYDFCKNNHLTLYDYIKKYEKEDIEQYFYHVLSVMEDAAKRGFKTEGYLPGSLHVKRKAKEMRERALSGELYVEQSTLLVAANSFAVAEENASGGTIVTAPTCGSAGVIPGVIYFLKSEHAKREDIVKYLMIAGLIGIVAKTNGSISGAECGCQAEIGVASAMAAAMVSAFYNFDNTAKIIQSAEIGLEHSLGLTCDPVCGYVQIPCIERCAVFALKAINAAKLALLLPHINSKVTFDDSVKTMLQTGKDLKSEYRETGVGGLAKFIK